MSSSEVVSLLAMLLTVALGDDLSSDTSVQKVSMATNTFAIDLYQKLIDPNDNLVTSPFSLAILLSILSEGASGDTAKEILAALHYEKLDTKTIEDSYKKVVPALQSDKDYRLSVADSVWIKSDLTVKDTFKNVLNKVYAAEEKTLSLKTGVTDINKWVDDHTNGKITKLIDSLDNSVAMVLVNAVYFKGTWKTKFNETLTKPNSFLENDKTNKNTPLMHVKSTFDYSESTDLNAQVLSLPYNGDAMNLVVFLPKENSNLKSMESKLTWSLMESSISQLSKQTVVLTLPKFNITSTLDLKNVLMKLNVKKAFDSTADFSGITGDQGLMVSKVAQKALIEVNEQGTEAAAATVVEVILKSAPIEPPVVTFEATHPFLYLLYHKPTKTVLFIGRYTKV